MTMDMFGMPPFKAPAVPVVISFGMGTNSTAMLQAAKENGIVPALIMAADTGDEWPHTYAHLDVVQAWLAKIGYPAYRRGAQRTASGLDRRLPVRGMPAPRDHAV